MSRYLARLALLAALLAVAGLPPARAGSPDGCPRTPHYHVGPRGTWWHAGAGTARGGNAPSLRSGNGLPGYPGTPGVPGLPLGRRYYNGRYFGTFNDRFYGPQYGNF